MNRILQLISTKFLGMFLALSLLSGTGIAFGNEKHSEMMMQAANEYGDLKLTPGQKQRIQTIQNTSKDKIQELASSMQKNHEALNQQVKATKYDANKIQQLADEQGSLISQMIVVKSKNMNQIYALLTPVQKQKLDAAQREAANRMSVAGKGFPLSQ
jgi:Spy/CpxP family protein refolding chaperone